MAALPGWITDLNDELWWVHNQIDYMISSAVYNVLNIMSESFGSLIDWLYQMLAEVWEAIRGMAPEATATISEAQTEVSQATSELAILTGGQIVPDQQAVANATMFVGGGVGNLLKSLVNWMVENVRKIYTTLAAVVKSIDHTLSKILEAIHFKTILKIHRILQIVSPQYRAMMKKVYNAIARVSEAVGLGPHFLLLALMNVRNLVMDVGSMFGKSYDLTQLEWMSTLNRYLRTITYRLNQYKNNPEALLFDLGELIERPSTDAKGTFQRGIITSLEGALEVAANIGDGLAKIGVDITKLHEDLPAFIKNAIPDPGTVFWRNLEGFLRDHYNPTISALRTEVGTWSDEVEAAKTRVGELVERLRKPGDLVRVVDELPALERDQQEAILSEVTNRRLFDLLGIMQPEIIAAREDLDQIGRTPLPPVTPSPPLTLEPLGLTPTSITPMIRRNTWFVGDY